MDKYKKNLEGEKDTLIVIQDAVAKHEGTAVDVPRTETGKFVKGVSGNPRGRPKAKDTFNRKVVIERCVKLGCDPISILAMFANGDSEGLQTNFIRDANGDILVHPITGEPLREQVDLKYRLDAAKDLLGYMCPKLRAVEIHDNTEEQTEKLPQVVVMLPSNVRDPESVAQITANSSDEAVLQLQDLSLKDAIGEDLEDYMEQDEDDES